MQFAAGIASHPSAITSVKHRSRVQMRKLVPQETLTPNNPLSEATPHPNENEYLAEPRPGEESPEQAGD